MSRCEAGVFPLANAERKLSRNQCRGCGIENGRQMVCRCGTVNDLHRRRQILWVSAREIGGVLSGQLRAEPVTIPDDAAFVGAFYEPGKDLFGIYVESWAFLPVMDGGQYPSMAPSALKFTGAEGAAEPRCCQCGAPDESLIPPDPKEAGMWNCRRCGHWNETGEQVS